MWVAICLKRGCGSCFLGYDFVGVREATCSAACVNEPMRVTSDAHTSPYHFGGVFLRDEEVGRIILQSGEVITKCGFCICSA